MASRTPSIHGYDEAPAVESALAFRLPRVTHYCGRLVAFRTTTPISTRQSKLELWSPNSLIVPFYPGAREDTFVPAAISDHYRRFDCHYGRFDPLFNAQEFDFEQPWLPLVRRPRPGNDSGVDMQVVIDEWAFSGDSPGLGGKINPNFLADLIARAELLEDEARTIEPSSRIISWNSRPKLPSMSHIQSLESSSDYLHVVESLSSMQRDLRLLDAWIHFHRLLVTNDGLESSKANVYEDEDLPQADDAMIGLWSARLTKRQFFWYAHIAKAPLFITHELSSIDLLSSMDSAHVFHSFVGGTDVIPLHGPDTCKYDTTAKRAGVAVTSDAPPSGIAKTAPFTAPDRRANSASKASKYHGKIAIATSWPTLHATLPRTSFKRASLSSQSASAGGADLLEKSMETVYPSSNSETQAMPNLETAPPRTRRKKLSEPSFDVSTAVVSPTIDQFASQSPFVSLEGQNDDQTPDTPADAHQRQRSNSNTVKCESPKQHSPERLLPKDSNGLHLDRQFLTRDEVQRLSMTSDSKPHSPTRQRDYRQSQSHDRSSSGNTRTENGSLYKDRDIRRNPQNRYSGERGHEWAAYWREPTQEYDYRSRSGYHEYGYRDDSYDRPRNGYYDCPPLPPASPPVSRRGSDRYAYDDRYSYSDPGSHSRDWRSYDRPSAYHDREWHPRSDDLRRREQDYDGRYRDYSIDSSYPERERGRDRDRNQQWEPNSGRIPEYGLRNDRSRSPRRNPKSPISLLTTVKADPDKQFYTRQEVEQMRAAQSQSQSQSQSHPHSLPEKPVEVKMELQELSLSLSQRLDNNPSNNVKASSVLSEHYSGTRSFLTRAEDEASTAFLDSLVLPPSNDTGTVTPPSGGYSSGARQTRSRRQNSSSGSGIQTPTNSLPSLASRLSMPSLMDRIQ